MPKKAKQNISETKLVLDTKRSVAGAFFCQASKPWEAIYTLRHRILMLGENLPYEEYDEISDGIWVHVSAYISPSAKITAPAIICGGAKLCHFSHVEGSVIGSFATVGECSCISSSIIFDKATVSSLTSIRASVIGYKTHIGAHCSFSDQRIDRSAIEFRLPEGNFPTEKQHLGSLVCDHACIGDGVVISAGSIIGEAATVHPLASVDGFVAEYSSY